MVGYKVLITTSGLGTRLGNLTDYTNKSLVRVGDKPAISHIIESYSIDTDFVISLGHFGAHVKQFLSLAYPERKFTFVEVDKYKGLGSSLAYSISKCKDYLQTPFIFHASDTIITNYKPVKPNFNYVLAAYRQDSSQYRTLNLFEGKLIKIHEKDEMGFDFSYIGISGIYDYKLFFEILENLLIDNSGDLSDVHVINKMISKKEVFYKQIPETDWYDTGNTSELEKTRKSFKSGVEILDKKDESIFFFDDFVIKFFYDIKININRVKRANILKGLVPNIIDYTDNFYKYEKVKGEVFSKTVNSIKFEKLLFWAKENLWKRQISKDFKNDCFNFYIEKTKNRINLFLQNFSDVTEINGIQLDTISNLIEKINSESLINGIPSQFHGDFILDNIIETNDGFSLIDWRQDFAGNLLIGDMYYDLAKLNHNLIVNHDIVNKNLFSSDPKNCYILTNSKLNDCREILHKFIINEGLDLKKIEILTAIIWINMSPLHEYPLNKFLFYFGKYTLEKNLNYES